MLNSHQTTVLQAQFRALHHATAVTGQKPEDRPPLSSSITALMKHGGLYSLLDPDVMGARLVAMAGKVQGATMAANLVPAVQSVVTSFFTRFVPAQPYLIPSSLMSYIVLPHEGTTYTELAAERDHPDRYESKDVPAIFTFIGQFIDHDLTMNAISLFVPQDDTPQDPAKPLAEQPLPPIPNPIVDGASPLIDLDSVYGPRVNLSSPQNTLFEADGKTFKLVRRDAAGNESTAADATIFDLKRDPTTGKGIISDQRNDENQLILQVHLLVERMHNKFAETHDFAGARALTILNWQFMILHDYLPRIIQPDVLRWVLEQIDKPEFGALKYKPCKDLATGKYRISMPHEFAIAFRFGHSQLKQGYHLNGTARQSDLFNNRLVGTGANGLDFDDLRGTQTLRAKNHIDWTVFLPTTKPVESNLIDAHVTAPAFDLPESTIPDDIKYIGNLPHRNLIRSRQIGLCSGEALAAFYGITPLTKAQVEPDETRWPLFMANEEPRAPGVPAKFETPLWYYILREAELSQGVPATNSMLGPLGSRLVAEVIVGAIAYADLSVLRPPPVFTPLPGAQPIPQHGPNDYLRTIVKWVNGLASL